MTVCEAHNSLPTIHSSFFYAMNEVLVLLLVTIFILVVVVIAWTLFWKFILAPNPLIRDFFDLDKGPTTEKNKKVK
jgi:hypothetical protein